MVTRGRKGGDQGQKRGICIPTIMTEDRGLRGMIQDHRKEIKKVPGIREEEGIRDPLHQKEIIALETTSTQDMIEDLAPQEESIEEIEDHPPVKSITDREITTEGMMKIIQNIEETTQDLGQERTP